MFAPAAAQAFVFPLPMPPAPIAATLSFSLGGVLPCLPST